MFRIAGSDLNRAMTDALGMWCCVILYCCSHVTYGFVLWFSSMEVLELSQRRNQNSRQGNIVNIEQVSTIANWDVLLISTITVQSSAVQTPSSYRCFENAVKLSQYVVEKPSLDSHWLPSPLLPLPPASQASSRVFPTGTCLLSPVSIHINVSCLYYVKCFTICLMNN